MDLSKPLIINTELFLQCHGHCAGCFLTSDERAEENTYADKIKEPILTLLKINKEYSHLILGFGRGNLLNLSFKSLDNLLNIMKECEELIPNGKLTYEVSSSLIGKVEDQIEKAIYLLDRNKKIYFNVVINSEITSSNFWNNWERVYEATANKRKSWGMTDNWGDILVLNVNPKMLPNLDFIANHIAKKGSPFNISLFPFSNEIINNEDLKKLSDWSKELWERFSHKDLNVKNYLNLLNTVDIGTELNDIVSYHKSSQKAYYFIDKNGEVTPGSLSIMGEVDYMRLLNKYSANPDVTKAFSLMQKTKPCNMCEYQKECLLSGAYLNMITNSKKIKDAKYCLSGYASLFELSKSSFSQIVS